MALVANDGDVPCYDMCQEDEFSMKAVHVTMGPNGRLVIPARLRAALQMERGGPLVASVEDGTIKLEPLDKVIRRVQANVRRYVPEGSDLAAELSEDRRREAEVE